MNFKSNFKYFNNLPSDIRKIQIPRYLCGSDVISLSRTCHDYYSLTKDIKLWIHLIKHDFNLKYNGSYSKFFYRFVFEQFKEYINLTLKDYINSRKDYYKCIIKGTEYFDQYIREIESRLVLKKFHIISDKLTVDFFDSSALFIRLSTFPIYTLKHFESPKKNIVYFTTKITFPKLHCSIIWNLIDITSPIIPFIEFIQTFKKFQQNTSNNLIDHILNEIRNYLYGNGSGVPDTYVFIPAVKYEYRFVLNKKEKDYVIVKFKLI